MKEARIHDLIAKAKRAPNTPYKNAGGGGWVAYVPYYDDQPLGPTTEIRAGSYQGILARIRASKARIFLTLAEQEYNITHPEWDEEVMCLMYRIEEVDPRDRLGVGSWESACRALVRKYR